MKFMDIVVKAAPKSMVTLAKRVPPSDNILQMFARDDEGKRLDPPEFDPYWKVETQHKRLRVIRMPLELYKQLLSIKLPRGFKILAAVDAGGDEDGNSVEWYLKNKELRFLKKRKKKGRKGRITKTKRKKMKKDSDHEYEMDTRMKDDRKAPTMTSCNEYLADADLEVDVKDEEGSTYMQKRESIANHGAY